MPLPKGCLIPIGGAEDKDAEHESFFKLGILKHILDQTDAGGSPRIGIITTAAAEPEDAFASYRGGFEKLGCSDLRHLDIRSRADAGTPEILELLESCNCVVMSGGDQLRLTTVFGGTPALGVISRKYAAEHFVIAGTSAGAMVMSNPMIYAGRAERANLKGEVRIVSGFGLLNNVIIDTHVDKRGRFSRIAQAVAAQPGALGIGLGEDTGLMVTKGHLVEVIGSGCILLVDGRNIVCTNMVDIPDGAPVTVQNLTVHIMAAGDAYDLTKYSFTKPASATKPA